MLNFVHKRSTLWLLFVNPSCQHHYNLAGYCVDMLNKTLIHIWSETEQDVPRFHHAIQNSSKLMNFLFLEFSILKLQKVNLQKAKPWIRGVAGGGFTVVNSHQAQVGAIIATPSCFEEHLTLEHCSFRVRSPGLSKKIFLGVSMTQPSTWAKVIIKKCFPD